jgi:hypothetical protein
MSESQKVYIVFKLGTDPDFDYPRLHSVYSNLQDAINTQNDLKSKDQDCCLADATYIHELPLGKVADNGEEKIYD